MAVHDTDIPCPVCAAGRIQWAKINFRRVYDQAFDWRLDAWCPLCRHGLGNNAGVMREIRARYNDLLGREIEAEQEAALVQVIGSSMNRWLNAIARRRSTEEVVK